MSLDFLKSPVFMRVCAGCANGNEATASLDPENEVLIQQAISALVAEKTVIVIAHRLQSIMSADNIIVLEDGWVAESGTHEQLLARGGIYANLWAEQSRAGIWRL